MILIGAGGHAKVICSIVESLDQKVDVIYDDNSSINKLGEYCVSGPYEPFSFQGEELIIAIGSNEARRAISKKCHHFFGKLIHPTAIVDRNVKLGAGTVVFQGAIIQRDTIIGEHCIVNTSASIDHDCCVHDFVHISPGSLLCGNVTIEEGTQIGAGATVIPGISIGKWCVIGAGAVIIQNIPDYSVVVGVPGRIIKKSKDEE
ncbi:acetyltransferase [Sediminibacterium soli]|uniref:acetyltransferase n=1 Tax=Sediminibacterium soli TaxID=2698829 RepID=UPI00137B52E6|nr:acetyltransferase [Sediminibacterium soli]NCI48064.1 acetyltransferase [Sediminibacterium soli]